MTRDGEPVAEIIPIDRTQRMLARWVKEGLIAELPPGNAAKAGTVSGAARRLLQAPPPSGPSASDVLMRMREEER